VRALSPKLGVAARVPMLRGRPQQNDRHERMHLTLKKEATRPAGANILQQQAKFDTFLRNSITKDPVKLSP